MARRLDDHSFMFGKGDSTSPFPSGARRKAESSASPTGNLGMNYPDTSEAQKKIQNEGAGLIKRNGQKEGFRYK